MKVRLPYGAFLHVEISASQPFLLMLTQILSGCACSRPMVLDVAKIGACKPVLAALSLVLVIYARLVPPGQAWSLVIQRASVFSTQELETLRLPWVQPTSARKWSTDAGERSFRVLSKPRLPNCNPSSYQIHAASPLSQASA